MTFTRLNNFVTFRINLTHQPFGAFVVLLTAFAYASAHALPPRGGGPAAEPTCQLQGSSIYARVGQVVSFTALLGGVPVQHAAWSLKLPAGTITPAGLFTAPAVVPPQGFALVEAVCSSSPLVVGSRVLPILAALPGLQTISPASVMAGTTNTFTLTGTGLSRVTAVIANRISIPFKLVSDTTITFQLATAPWAIQTPISVTAENHASGGGVSNPVQSRIQAPAIPFDVAARFLSQAGFGPTAAGVARVQQLGLAGWIDAQINTPPYDYTTSGISEGQWYRNTQNGSTALRQRVSLALSHIYVTAMDAQCDLSCSRLWESVIEQDAFANARQLLTDVSLTPIMGYFLNNVYNFGAGGAIPNQNFGREIMQLMTIGPDQLNQDGSKVMGTNGKPVPTYTQDNVVGMSYALSGWLMPATFTKPYGPQLQALVLDESTHGQGAKNILPNVTLPAGQGGVSDMNTTLNALFNHPNYGPFLSRRLIQALVTSNPSPGYMSRISATFANDGNGVRGNLGAVVKAILLDPEARVGDLSISQNSAGGHFMEPVLYLSSLMNTVGGFFTDDQVESIDSAMGEQQWNEPNVFSYFDPAHTLSDGTPAPEEQLLTSSNVTAGMLALYGAFHQGWGGLAVNWNTSPFWNCASVAELLDRIDHYLLHGRYTPAEELVLANYAATKNTSTVNDLIPDLVFLAASSTDYKIIR